MAGDADRNLLLGILAHQMDFVSRDRLFGAMNAWLLRKDQPLGEVLVERGDLTAPRRRILEALVEEHVNAHGGDAARSLEAVGPVAAVIEDIGRLSDADVQASIAHVRGEMARSLGAGRAPSDRPEIESWMTRGIESLGAPTADNGRFLIVRPHAQGGLGIVSVAIDNELDREVAFKEIQPAHADRESSRSQFVLEAEFTGKLEHPGIIPVYGLGRDAVGRPFYAMRFIRGESLADAINRFHDRGRDDADNSRRPLELRELLGRFIDVCDAVGYAHSRSVLHRDLKPANVMLGPYGETMVVDWGLAMLLERPPADAASPEGPVRVSKADCGALPSERGAAIGSPLYMPPEQAEGAIDRLGPASDVYGLGAILYEVLTGRPPVAGARIDEVLERVRRGEIVPPRRIEPRVPAGLEAVCLKALAMRPEDRYPSALRLAADIKAWLADEPVSARPEPLGDRIRRWARRHQSVAAAFAAALLVGLVGLGAVAIVQTRARTALATLNEDLDRNNTALASANEALDAQRHRADIRRQRAIDGVRRFRDVVAADPELQNDPALDLLRRRLLNEPLVFFRQFRDSLVADGDDAPDVLGQLAVASAELGALAADIGDVGDALTARREEVTVRERLLTLKPGQPEARRDLASALVEEADLLAAAGRADDALAGYRTALDIRTELAAERPDDTTCRKDLANSHYSLGVFAATTGRTEDARREFQQGHDILQQMVDAGAADAAVRRALAYHDNGLGNTLSDLGLTADALRADDAALTGRRELASGADATASHRHDLAISELNRGRLLAAIGRTKEAAGAYRAARMTLADLVAAHPTTTLYAANLASVEARLGNLLLDQGDATEAAEAFDAALGVRRGIAAGNPTVTVLQNDTAVGLRQGASVDAPTGRMEEAIAAVREALTIDEGLAAKNPADPVLVASVAGDRRALARLLEDAGLADEALTVLGAARADLERAATASASVVAFRADLATVESDIGALLIRCQRAEEALDPLDRALAALGRLVEEHPEEPTYRSRLAHVHDNRGAALTALGRRDAALESIRAALAVRRDLAADQPERVEYQLDLAANGTTLAASLLAMDRADEALPTQAEALAIQQRLAAAHPEVARYRAEVARCLQGLGACLSAVHRPADAIKAMAEGTELQGALVEEQPAVPQYRIDLVLMLQGLARLREDARQPAEAARALEQAAIHGRSLLAEAMNDLGRRETMKAILMALREALAEAGEPTVEIDDEILALDRPPPSAVKNRGLPQTP